MEAVTEQVFTVFLRAGAPVEVNAETYVREGADWVLYRRYRDPAGRQEVARYPTASVNGIALKA